MWCKKYKNEYAGHDAKRDMRLGFVFINLSTLDLNVNQTGKLYDVISETEQHHGEIKVNLFVIVKFYSSVVNNLLNVIF